ncbi:hypothetical protein EES39_07360 [Streptomyces sp. ADI92-24]|nr:hypothetical protein EES39_07360 [Streptomyces sp. ADI92-24]
MAGTGETVRCPSTAMPSSARSSPTSSAKVCRVRGSPSMSSVTALSSAMNAQVPPARNATTSACGTRRRRFSGRPDTLRRRPARRAPARPPPAAGTAPDATVRAAAMAACAGPVRESRAGAAAPARGAAGRRRWAGAVASAGRRRSVRAVATPEVSAPRAAARAAVRAAVRARGPERRRWRGRAPPRPPPAPCPVPRGDCPANCSRRSRRSVPAGSLLAPGRQRSGGDSPKRRDYPPSRQSWDNRISSRTREPCCRRSPKPGCPRRCPSPPPWRAA